jgi:glycine betaine/proline transport system ATP-binding protein
VRSLNLPDILLMDEAFSALDPLIRVDMQNLLLKLQAELNKTILFITYGLDEALRIGDRIAILRDGEIIQQGNPQDIVLSPADSYIADFARDINRGRVIEIETGQITRDEVEGIQGPNVAATTVLEDVARLLSDADAEVAIVIDGENRAVGSVTRGDLMDAMIRERSD